MALEDKNNTRYFMEGQAQEERRLVFGHEVMMDCMEKAVWASIDLTKPGLKILDSATASGKPGSFILGIYLTKYEQGYGFVICGNPYLQMIAKHISEPISRQRPF